MIITHYITEDRFAALAAGLGGPEAVEQLGSLRHSKHLLLLRFLKDAGACYQACDTAVDVLVEADRVDKRVVASLMTDPMVGSWLVRTARKIDGEPQALFKADIAQLGALAAAAAFRTRLDVEIPTQPLNGSVTLPTLGAAVVGSDGPAIVTIAGGRATVTGGSARVAVSRGDPAWLGLHRLLATHGELDGSLAIEDGNPYRDCYHAPPTDRLSADEVRDWQKRYSEAWQLLVDYIPERASELAAGLRSVVPLVIEDESTSKSATARDLFGTLGLTRPRSGHELAVTLVHELQHSKLSALLDIEPLYTMDGQERHLVPWRADARPTAGLIQGVYAFLGVADTWRALRAAPGLEELATRKFAFEREQVDVGLSTLERSDELTPKGRAFTAGLRRSVDRLRSM